MTEVVHSGFVCDRCASPLEVDDGALFCVKCDEDHGAGREALVKARSKRFWAEESSCMEETYNVVQRALDYLEEWGELDSSREHSSTDEGGVA